VTLWPELPYDAWRDTLDTLHMKLQVVGKLRLALSPFEPEWANVPLYVTARGLGTSPLRHPSGEVFDVDVDLHDHAARVRTGDGRVEEVALRARPVAEFYEELMGALERSGVPVEITTLPSEVPDPIPFPDDTTHATYDPEWAHRFWRTLATVAAAMKEHRAPFRGRHTPVHFFWGTFDLAYTRYNGRPAEPHGDNVIMRRSTDAEQICCGWWPGDERVPAPTFFAYAYPKPTGIESEPGWDDAMGELLLPYDDVRTAADPRRALLDWLERTYGAGARLRGWDAALVGG
jgi:uncharacterized protein DUF5996